MKKPIVYIVVVLALSLAPVAAYAQMQGAGPGGPPSADQRLQRMTQMLDLTADQQEKIKPILESETTQMQQLRSDTSLSRENRMTKMKEIRDNTVSQINPILTPDQQKKYAELRSRMGPGHGMGPGGPGQSAPPSQPQQ